MEAPFPSNDVVHQQLVALQQENLRLSEQVKRLVKTEHGLYQFQEKLDNQIRIYHQLYEAGNKFNATFDVVEILQIATEFVLYHLNFERCVAFLYDPGGQVYQVQALDGYYDEGDRARIAGLRLTLDQLRPSSLVDREQILCLPDSAEPALVVLGGMLDLHEYVAFPLGAEVRPPVGLLFAGNTARQAPYQTRVEPNSVFVIGMANLVSQVGTTLRMSREIAERERRLAQEARGRERIEHELRVARLVQQTLLAKAVPPLSGWHVDRHYQPARAVGGDFYDFLSLPDGRLGLVIGDVSGKGVPAALLMASTRSILRAVAQGVLEPGLVLAAVNELVCPDVPPHMFVTCFYAVLDPNTGRLHYANAGHPLPICWHAGQASELRATGMPLGLMHNMDYPAHEAVLAPGAGVLFYSDGVVEAHDHARAMFTTHRLATLVAEHVSGGSALIRDVLNELEGFTGADQEQEDDITLVTLEHMLAVS